MTPGGVGAPVRNRKAVQRLKGPESVATKAEGALVHLSGRRAWLQVTRLSLSVGKGPFARWVLLPAWGFAATPARLRR